MNRFSWMSIGLVAVSCWNVGNSSLASSLNQSTQSLFVAYPPANHETTYDRIFLIGTAPPDGTVLVNGKPIARNAAGNFAPSFPLSPGVNTFTLKYQQQELTLKVTRLSTAPDVPTGLAFGKDSLLPNVNVARQPGEWVCFGAIAPPAAKVTVQLANQTVALAPQTAQATLPPNSAILTQTNQPEPATVGHYGGCTRFTQTGNLGQPEFQLALAGKTLTQKAPGSVTILPLGQLEVAQVTADSGVARTGPSTDHSRMTPLPKGTQATVTGYEGEWLRLDYGAWIRRSEVQVIAATVPPTSLIRSIKARQVNDWTEVSFPLQVPVPVSVQQDDRAFTLTLHNTVAQTDTIRLDDDPLIQRLDWRQSQPDRVQYVFHLKTAQQWGYKLRYEGSTLVLSLRHPPVVTGGTRLPLAGVTVVLDPGHGGPEDLGARGPNGYPEKAVALTISQRVREALVKRGARVYMTREADVDLPLQDRVALIQKVEPTIALSLHYNALPDNGDALRTAGISTFWYQPQAQDLALSLHNSLTARLNRPSYGVYWNNLAMTRPAVAPSVLLELGFMINPDEFEWIVNSAEQQRLAEAIAEGITAWVQKQR